MYNQYLNIGDSVNGKPLGNPGNHGGANNMKNNGGNIASFDNMNGTSPKLYNGGRGYGYQHNNVTPPANNTVNSRMTNPMGVQGVPNHIGLPPRNFPNYSQAAAVSANAGPNTPGASYYDANYGHIHPQQYQQYQQMLQPMNANYPVQQQGLYQAQYPGQTQQPVQHVAQQVNQHMNQTQAQFQPHYQAQGFVQPSQQPQQMQPQQMHQHTPQQDPQSDNQQYQSQRQAQIQGQTSLVSPSLSHPHAHPSSFEQLKQQQLNQVGSYQPHQTSTQPVNLLQPLHHPPLQPPVGSQQHQQQQAQSRSVQPQSQSHSNPLSQPQSHTSTPGIFPAQTQYDNPSGQQHQPDMGAQNLSSTKDLNGNFGRKRGRKSKNQTVAATNPTFDQFGHSSVNSVSSVDATTNQGQPPAVLHIDGSDSTNLPNQEKRKRGRPKTLLFDPSINQYIDSSHANYKSLKKQLKDSGAGSPLSENYLERSLNSNNPPSGDSNGSHSSYLTPHEFNELEIQNLLQKKDRRGRPRKFGFEETGITVKGVKVGGIKKKKLPKVSDDSVVKKARGRPRK